MRFANISVRQQILRGCLKAGVLAAAVLSVGLSARSQQLVTDAPMAKVGGTAFVGKYTATSVFSAGPTFHFTAPVTITSVAYDPGPGGVQELGIRSLYGCSYNQVTSAGTVCAIETEIASRYAGWRYGTLRVTTTTGVFTVPVEWQSVGAQVAVTPGIVSTPKGADAVSGNSLAVDALQNIYVAGDNVVRKIDATTGAVTVVAGVLNDANRDGDGGQATAAHIGYPVDVATSPAGDVYLVSSAPYQNDAVRKVDGGTGVISTVTNFVTGRVPAPGNSGGNGTDGAVVVDDQGNVYASVTKTNALVVTAGDGTGTTYLIGAAAGDAGCNGGGEYAPTSLAVSGGYVYFYSAAAMYKISTDATACHEPVLVAGTGTAGNSGDGGLATKAAFGFVSGLAVDAAGNVYLADATNETVRVVSAATGLISTVAGTGSALPGVTVAASWSALAMDARGNLYVLSASGLVQKIDVSAGALSYPNTAVGQTNGDGPHGVVFTNIGNDALAAGAAMPELSSADFVLSSTATTCGVGDMTTLAAGASCAAGVNFMPTAGGSLQGVLSLGGVDVVLLGTAGAPSNSTSVNLSTSSVDFGKVPQGQSGTRTIYVSNTGALPLNISSIMLSDTKNFVVAGNCGSSVAASSSCSLIVKFQPQATGTVGGTITLTDNGFPNTQTISLAGTGSVAGYTVTVNPRQLTLVQGQSGTASFVFAPTGGFNGAVSFACTGLPVGATCNFAPAMLTANGSDQQQTSTLTVTTRGASDPVAQNTVSGSGMTLASLAGFGGLLLAGLAARRKRAVSIKLMGLLLLLSLGIAGATGCGSGGTVGYFTPAGTTAVNVVTTSGADSQTTTFMLTVK